MTFKRMRFSFTPSKQAIVVRRDTFSDQPDDLPFHWLEHFELRYSGTNRIGIATIILVDPKRYNLRRQVVSLGVEELDNACFQ